MSELEGTIRQTTCKQVVSATLVGELLKNVEVAIFSNDKEFISDECIKNIQNGIESLKPKFQILQLSDLLKTSHENPEFSNSAFSGGKVGSLPPEKSDLEVAENTEKTKILNTLKDTPTPPNPQPPSSLWQELFSVSISKPFLSQFSEIVQKDHKDPSLLTNEKGETLLSSTLPHLISDSSYLTKEKDDSELRAFLQFLVVHLKDCGLVKIESENFKCDQEAKSTSEGMKVRKLEQKIVRKPTRRITLKGHVGIASPTLYCCIQKTIIQNLLTTPDLVE